MPLYVFCMSFALLQSAQASFSSLLLNPSAALQLGDVSKWLHEGQAEGQQVVQNSGPAAVRCKEVSTRRGGLLSM